MLRSNEVELYKRESRRQIHHLQRTKSKVRTRQEADRNLQLKYAVISQMMMFLATSNEQ